MYCSFLDAHWRPGDIDALELWQVGHLLRPAEQQATRVTTRNAGEARKTAIERTAAVAAASEQARREGRALTPAGVDASNPAIAEALAKHRAGVD